MHDLVVQSIPRAFSGARVEKNMPEGMSFAQILEEFGIPESRYRATFCSIDGQEVPAEWYHKVKPKPGHNIVVRALPAEGAIQPFNKGTLRVVATLAFQAIGFVVQNEFGAIPGMVVSIGGILLVNALIPPPDLTLEDIFSLSGAQNRMAPNAPVPVVYGTHRVFPPLIARPFTHVTGDDQFLNLLFLIGYGPMKIDQLKIGEQDISNLEGVTAQVRAGFPVDTHFEDGFANVVLESKPNKVLLFNVWNEFTTDADADEISLDISFKNGLFAETGSLFGNQTVEINVQYRPTGATQDDWIVVNRFTDEEFYAAVQDLGADATTIRASIFTNLASLETLTDTMITDIQAHGVGDRKVPLGQIAILNRAWQHIGVLAGVLNTDDGGQTTTRDNLVANAATMVTLVDGFTETAGLLGVFEDDFFEINVESLLLIRTVRILRNVDSGRDINMLAISPDFQGMYQSQFYFDSIFGTPPNPIFRFTDRRGILIRKGVQWPVVRGRYDVRLRRVSPDLDEDSRSQDEATWTSVRAIRNTTPVPLDAELATIALRIRATDQLQGSLDSFNCVAAHAIPVWNGSSWDDPVLTDAHLVNSATPAWIYADMLKGKGARFPVLDSRLDLTKLEEWETETLANGREFNAVLTRGGTLFENLKNVAAVGRARFHMRDGKYAVGLDLDQTGSAVQMFTPRNSFDFKVEKPFRAVPNELRVHFLNEEVGWQEDEVSVYNEGFNIDNAVTYDTLELIGVTSKAQAWKDGKYYLNNMRLRPEIYSFKTDVEHLVCELGDMILVRNDVTLWGLAAARIKAINVSGPNTISLDLDEEINYGADSHQIRIRQEASGTISFLDIPIDEASETSNVVTLTTPITTSGSNIDIGDLLAVGVVNIETVELVVKEIRHRVNFQAELICVDHSPGVHFLEDIPEFDPSITLPHPQVDLKPSIPIIDSILTNEAVLERDTDGSLVSRIVVLIVPSPVGMNEVAPQTLQGQFRPSIPQGALAPHIDPSWVDVALTEFSSRVISFAPVTDRETYDIRVRTLSRLGIESDWVLVPNITIIGKTSPPPDPSGMLINTPYMTWEYSDPPLDLAGFRVRVADGSAATWETATPLHAGLISDTTFNTNFAGFQTKKFFVKAVDTSGNESTGYAFAIVNLGDIEPDNIIETHDYKDLVWPGTITNAFINGSNNLETDGEATLFWVGSPTALFWNADQTADFWATTAWLNAVYKFSKTIDASNGPARLSFDLTVEASRWALYYRTNAMKILWPTPLSLEFWPALTDSFWFSIQGWLPWPGSIFAEFGLYEFKLEFDGGTTFGLVSKLTLLIDVEDVEEVVEDVAIGASPTRLPISKDFRAIRAITMDLQDTGTGIAIRVKDKGIKVPVSSDFLTSGPEIEVLDDAGVAVAGVVDARMKGY